MNEIKTHDTMSPEAQRIAIAEACGFINVRMWSESCIASMGINAKGEYWSSLGVPDYLNDLNAMNEAEGTLNRGSGYHETGGYGLYLVALDHDVSATASQRCEAFLRTIGKWVTA